eukprot:1159545-Pelagomonas_calceolata.AAC.10
MGRWWFSVRLVATTRTTGRHAEGSYTSSVNSVRPGAGNQKDTIHQLQNVIMRLEDAKAFEKKLRRQRKLSLHQLRRMRHIGSKSRGSPSPEDERGVNVDRVGFWQHAAPGHQCYVECFYCQWHGMGRVNSPTHTQEDWVDSDLCTLERCKDVYENATTQVILPSEGSTKQMPVKR